MRAQDEITAVSLGWVTIIGLAFPIGIFLPIVWAVIASTVSVTVPPALFVVPFVVLLAFGGGLATRSYPDWSMESVILGGVGSGLGGSTIGFLSGILVGETFAVLALGMVPAPAEVNPGKTLLTMGLLFGGSGIIIGAGAGFALGTIGGLLARYVSDR